MNNAAKSSAVLAGAEAWMNRNGVRAKLDHALRRQVAGAKQRKIGIPSIFIEKSND